MKSRRWIWIITLLFYCSGCTAYAPVYLPGTEPAQSGMGQPDKSGRTGYSPGILPHDSAQPVKPPAPNTVKVGMRVRMTLNNGDTVSGGLVEITGDALVFGQPGNYGLRKEYYPFGDILKIEAAQGTSFTNFVAVFILVTIVTLVGLVVMYTAAMSDMN